MLSGGFMRKLVFFLMALIAVVTFIRAYSTTTIPAADSVSKIETINTRIK
jgi:hypothetical protein